MVSDEMTLEEKIVAWGNQRSDWQRYLLKRIADGKTFTETDYDELVEDILAQRIPDTNLDLQSVSFTSTGSQTVRLISIEKVHHINALETPDPLTFDPLGITIIYGDNGAGKSGYARLLKCITRARHQEDILSDVFRDESDIKPSASFKIQIKDIENKIRTEESFMWPDSNITESHQMLFYDTACCDEYINTESDFPYRPTAFLIMDRLIEACSAVRSRIDSKLSKKMSSPDIPRVDDDMRHTEIGKFLTELNKDSSVKILDGLIAGLDDRTESLQELKIQEARLATSNTDSEKQCLVRSAEKFESLSSYLKHIQTVLGDDALRRIEYQRCEVQSLTDTVNSLAKSKESEPLKGVGSPSWKELWRSAKQFSEEEAYPNDVFPPTGTRHRCLLCQQELDKDSRQRLRRLDQVIKDNAQVELSEADRQYNLQIEQITDLDILSEAIKIQLADLQQAHSGLILRSRKILRRFVDRQERVKRLANFVNFIDLIDEVNLDESNVSLDESIGLLDKEAAELRKHACELSDPSVVQNKLRAVTRSRKEVELLEAAKSSKHVIINEINCLKDRADLQSVKESAATGPISRKISELSKEDVTGFIDIFRSETKRLRLKKVTVTKIRASKGVLLHKPELVGPSQDAPLPRVFSEGEKSALGLAAFFTEARLDSSKSAIILDDPVSSLDHRHRALVARRLVKLAKNRQVIIFTHDVSFVSDLKLEAGRKNVKVTSRSVERNLAGEKKPGRCVTKHPWHMKDVLERLNQLESDLNRIQNKTSNWDQTLNWDQEEYGKQVSAWAGDLSETLERMIRQYIIEPILADGGLEVRPRMVKILTKFSDADERAFRASYSRISKWVKRHDKSGQVNYTPPEVDDLRDELDRVKTWSNRIKRYQN